MYSAIAFERSCWAVGVVHAAGIRALAKSPTMNGCGEVFVQCMSLSLVGGQTSYVNVDAYVN